MSVSAVSFAEIHGAGHAAAATRIEYQWIDEPTAPDTLATQAPLMVFLHEGLGSLAMWRNFPAQLCAALGCRGLVYSRPGYGQSTPRAADEQWAPDFMHRQAVEVLPALLEALQVDTQANPIWLFGHSDGGSIALLHAARYSKQVAGVVVLAPHLFVEEVSVQNIAKARSLYLETDLRQRLARYHADVDSAFWGWNQIWLHPDFKRWNIEGEIESICCPVLAVQGLDDEYGTLAQIRAIARRVPQTQLLEIAACAHSPHRDQPTALIAAVAQFFKAHIK